MKTVTLGLVVVAVVVLAIGLASSGPRVDIDYLVGTWHDASLAAVAAVAAGLLLVCGVAAAIIVVMGQAADRRALEGELQRTYVRLREAEGRPRPHPDAGAAATALSPSTSGQTLPPPGPAPPPSGSDDGS